MNRKFALMVLLSALILICVPSYCQDRELKTVDGPVVSVDPQNSVIVVKTIENMKFMVAPDAQITDDSGMTIQLSQIDPGNYVMVDYYDDSSHAHIAENINVEYQY